MGRIKGEGPVQTFFKESGGRLYVISLYQEFKSAEAIADFIFERFGLLFCGNSIRNILRQYGVSINPTGGDRQSKKAVEFRQKRDKCSPKFYK